MPPTQSRQRITGIAEVIISGAGYGFLGLFGKWAFEAGMTPGQLLTQRFLIAAVLLFLGIVFTRRHLLRLPARTLLSCALLGIFGYACFSSLYFQALKGLSASLTVLLLYTYPVFVSLGGLIFFNETLSLKSWIALPITVIGTSLLVWGDINVNNYVSLGFGFGSAIVYSGYILASRKLLHKTNPLASTFYIQLFTTVGLTLLNLSQNPINVPQLTSQWHILFGIALIATVMPMVLFLDGLKKIKSYEASILSSSEPVTTIFLAALLLGESMSALQGLGAGCVILAMILISWPSRKITTIS